MVALDDVLISAQGDVHPTQSPALRRKHGAQQRDFDFPAYAIRNLGYMRFERHSERSVLSFRPRLTTPVSMAAAFIRIAERPPVRIVVRVFNETAPEDGQPPGWRHELFGELGLAFRRVENLASSGPSWPPTNRYLAEALDLASLADQRGGGPKALFDAWRELGGIWSDDLVPRFKEAGVGDRLTVLSRTGDDRDRLRIDYASTGYSSFKSWGVPAAGLDIESLPDREYGAWVAVTIRAMFRDHQPRFDYVDALIRSQDRPSLLVCYDRLLLPWRSSSGLQIGTSVAAARAVFPQL